MIKLYIADIYDFNQADYAKMYSLLDCAMKQKIDKKNNIKDKIRSLSGWILLWRGVYELYGKTDIVITFNSHGKPLCNLCYFNISHSGDRVVCVISDREVGIDIQQVRDIKPREIYKFFNSNECSYVNEDKNNISKRYTEVFTKKEAAVKMLGIALSNSCKIDVFSNEFSFETKYFDDFVLTICTKNVSIM